MFGKLFRKKSQPKVAVQPVDEVFPWPAGAVLKPLDRLTLVLPVAMLDPDESISSVIDCDEEAEIALPQGDDKLYIRLQPGMSISVSKNVQALVLPWEDGENQPKRIEVVQPPTLGA